MKVAFFLTPKADIAWVKSTSTVRQAIERMEAHSYTAVPLLTPDGHYAGTLTEGDLLWFLKKNHELSFDDTERVPLERVERRMTIRTVHIDAEIEELLALALDQNYVPVVDDRDVFIGIVRRRSIIEYLRDHMRASVTAI